MEMILQKPVSDRNDQLLFTAAAADHTVVNGMTILRLVPAEFDTTLRFVRNAKGSEPVTILVSPDRAKEKILSYWNDHRQLPVTDRLEFILGDIAHLARMSGQSEQALVLQLSFHNISDKITPFLPHAGLRLIYDTMPEDAAWGVAQLTEGAKPKLGDLALYVDVVATEVLHERVADTTEKREAFVAQLEQYKNGLAHKKYPGVSDQSPEYFAYVVDVDLAFLSKDPESVRNGDRPYNPILQPLLGSLAPAPPEKVEPSEGGGGAHLIEHGAELAALHFAEKQREESKKHDEEVAREQTRHLDNEHKKENLEADRKVKEEAEEARIYQNEQEEAVRVRADELREEQQIREDEREEDAAGLALGEGAEEYLRENHRTGEEAMLARDETGERIETLQDEGGEQETLREQFVQGGMEQENRVLSDGRESEDLYLRNAEDAQAEQADELRLSQAELAESTGEAQRNLAEQTGEAQAGLANEAKESENDRAAGEQGKEGAVAEAAVGAEFEPTGGGETGAASEGEGSEADGDAERTLELGREQEIEAQKSVTEASAFARETQAKTDEMFAAQNETLAERSLEANQEADAEGAEEQAEGARKLQESVGEAQAAAAEASAENAKRADELEAENVKLRAEFAAVSAEASRAESERDEPEAPEVDTPEPSEGSEEPDVESGEERVRVQREAQDERNLDGARERNAENDQEQAEGAQKLRESVDEIQAKAAEGSAENAKRAAELEAENGKMRAEFAAVSEEANRAASERGELDAPGGEDLEPPEGGGEGVRAQREMQEDQTLDVARERSIGNDQEQAEGARKLREDVEMTQDRAAEDRTDSAERADRLADENGKMQDEFAAANEEANRGSDEPARGSKEGLEEKRREGLEGEVGNAEPVAREEQHGGEGGDRETLDASPGDQGTEQRSIEEGRAENEGGGSARQRVGAESPMTDQGNPEPGASEAGKEEDQDDKPQSSSSGLDHVHHFEHHGTEGLQRAESDLQGVAGNDFSHMPLHAGDAGVALAAGSTHIQPGVYAPLHEAAASVANIGRTTIPNAVTDFGHRSGLGIGGVGHEITGQGVTSATNSAIHHMETAGTRAAVVDAEHTASGVDTLSTFQRASGINTHWSNEWHPLGNERFAFGNFRGTSDGKLGPILMSAALVNMPGARKPKIDMVDKMTRRLISNHAAAPRKGKKLKFPNTQHSFEAMFNQMPAPAPAPFSEG